MRLAAKAWLKTTKPLILHIKPLLPAGSTARFEIFYQFSSHREKGTTLRNLMKNILLMKEIMIGEER